MRFEKKAYVEGVSKIGCVNIIRCIDWCIDEAY